MTLMLNIVSLAFLLSLTTVHMIEPSGQVLFTATFSGVYKNLHNNAVVIYNRATLNIGDGYDSRTGVFTAPYTGLYRFDWTSLTSKGKRFITKLQLNGAIKAFNHASGSGEWDSATQMLYLRLKKGDRVWIEVRGNDGQYLFGDGFSTFNGRML